MLGRGMENLKSGLGDRRKDVLFVGYQTRVTPGRDILSYDMEAQIPTLAFPWTLKAYWLTM